jgi:putative flavoprotein involved in K+ transport
MPDLDVVVIGAGQAGLSISHCLSRSGIEHLVLEREAIGASWQFARWSSFCLVTPNWATRLAGRWYDGAEPDGFMPRDELVQWLRKYASDFAVPVQTPVTVTAVVPRRGGRYELHTAQGRTFVCRAVVVATATHAHPKIPAFANSLDASIAQVHASQYRDPQSLAPGGVMVVGSAQSGCQFADELLRAGRAVWLATGRTGRLPRRYRGRDIIAWQQAMGFLDRPASALEEPAHRFRPDPHLTGARGGETLDLLELSKRGAQLTGRLRTIAGCVAQFDSDLDANLGFADDFAARVLGDVDAFISRQAVKAPVADNANSDLGYQGDRFVPEYPSQLDLVAAGLGTVIWATGFHHDFTWVKAPVFDQFGYPIQSAGVTSSPGLHFLGLNYVERRGSGILYGVGEDAERLCEVIRANLASK